MFEQSLPSIIECTKPGTHVEVFNIDSGSDKQRLKMDLTKLADQAMPTELNAVSLYARYSDDT